MSWILHLLIGMAREEDRKVRPSLLWMASLLLAFGSVWAWMVPVSEDPHVPVALIWLVRIALPAIWLGVTTSAMRASA